MVNLMQTFAEGNPAASITTQKLWRKYLAFLDMLKIAPLRQIRLRD